MRELIRFVRFVCDQCFRSDVSSYQKKHFSRGSICAGKIVREDHIEAAAYDELKAENEKLKKWIAQCDGCNLCAAYRELE